MALAVSIGEPPPKPIRQSCPRVMRCDAGLDDEVGGFGDGLGEHIEGDAGVMQRIEAGG